MENNMENKEGKQNLEPSSTAQAKSTGRRGRNKNKPQFDKLDDPFKPRFLATPGPTKDEPLSDNAFFSQPGEAFAQLPGVKEIYSGSDGLVHLATEEYKQLAAHTVAMKRSISVSGYCYYAAALTYARMLDLDAKNGGMQSYDERMFIDGCLRYRPPKILNAYLAGFGNTAYPNGFHDLKFRMQKPDYVSNGLTGWFGEMTANARYYSAYPCLAVFATRIMKDFSANGFGIEWNLPDGIAPVNTSANPQVLYALRPGCQGYSRANKMDPATIQTYSLIGINGDTFPISNQSISINWNFMNEVEAWVHEINGLESAPFPTTLNGSRGQLIQEKIEQVGAMNNLSSSTWKGYSAERLASSVEYAGSTFLYRVVKTYSGPGSLLRNNIFFPYDSNAHISSLMNFLRDAESDEMLEIENGWSSEFAVTQRLTNFVQADIRARR